MIFSIGPAIAAKPIVSSGGGNPVLLQTAFAKFMDAPDRIYIANYANVYNGAVNVSIPDNVGSSTGITITPTGNDWQYELEVDYPTNDPDFVGAAMSVLAYLNPAQTKTLTFSVPNTPNRRYRLTFMVYQSSGGDENITKVTIGGVSQILGGGNRILGKTSFSIDNPASNIVAIVSGQPEGNYPCINAVKIEIYQI